MINDAKLHFNYRKIVTLVNGKLFKYIMAFNLQIMYYYVYPVIIIRM
jgi:hypothetical protein